MEKCAWAGRLAPCRYFFNGLQLAVCIHSAGGNRPYFFTLIQSGSAQNDVFITKFSETFAVTGISCLSTSAAFASAVTTTWPFRFFPVISLELFPLVEFDAWRERVAELAEVEEPHIERHVFLKALGPFDRDFDLFRLARF